MKTKTYTPEQVQEIARRSRHILRGLVLTKCADFKVIMKVSDELNRLAEGTIKTAATTNILEDKPILSSCKTKKVKVQTPTESGQLQLPNLGDADSHKVRPASKK